MGITDLRDEMAVQMEGEFSITKNFVKFYMPFEPTDDDVNAFIQSAVSTASEKPTMCYTEQGLRFIDFTVAPGKDVGTEKRVSVPFRRSPTGSVLQKLRAGLAMSSTFDSVQIPPSHRIFLVPTT